MIVLDRAAAPSSILLVALSVDIGNWWVHKRHLQLQADAAALAGGALFGKCFTDPSGANAAIQNEATKYNGAAGSVYNGQVGNANKGTITVLYQSKTYAAGSHAAGRHRDAAALQHAELMFDVKATEANLPLLFDIPGLEFVPSISAHARVQLKTVIQQDGMLPVAVPDLRFNYAFATFVNEATGAVLATSELAKTGTSAGQQLWSSLAGVNVPISASHIGVRIRLVGGTDPTAACGQLYTECYDLAVRERRRAHPRLEQRDGAERPERVAPRRHLRARRVLRGGRLLGRRAGRGRPGRDAPAHGVRRDDGGLGDRRRRGEVPADAGRLERARHVDARLGVTALRAAGRTTSGSSGASSRRRARGTARPARTRTTTRARTRARSGSCSAGSSRRRIAPVRSSACRSRGRA